MRNKTVRAARRVAIGVALLMVMLVGAAVMTHAIETPAYIMTQPGVSAERDVATSANDGMAAESAVESGACVDDDCVPYDYNTEEYSAIDEQGFIATTIRPLSTLSSDVDTASYCNLRRMIREGMTVDGMPSGAVRIEEMLNYFTYSYNAPTGEDLFGTTVHLADCPWNPDTKLLMMGFATKPEEKAAVGRNLVFLIDSSGSMQDANKLPLLKRAFAKLVSTLTAEDRISIVTYSGAERVLAQGVSGSDRNALMRAIRSIQADGCTNGEAGLTMAYDLAEAHYKEGGVNRIILASDGDLNVGMTSESDLRDYVADKRDKGIYLSVLGFGTGNYKDNKMEALADNGNGQYHYIDCEDEAQRVFGEKLAANLSPLADDVKLQVEFNPAQVKGYRLIGYENRAMEDAEFEDAAADAGDVGPSSQFTVAYEVVPADSKMDIPASRRKYGTGAKGGAEPSAQARAGSVSDEWLTCTMRYKPVSGGNAEQQLVISGNDFETDPGDDFEFAASVIEFGMLMRGSEYAGQATFDNVLSLASNSAHDELRQEFTELVHYVAGGYAYGIQDTSRQDTDAAQGLDAHVS